MHLKAYMTVIFCARATGSTSLRAAFVFIIGIETAMTQVGIHFRLQRIQLPQMRWTSSHYSQHCRMRSSSIYRFSLHAIISYYSSRISVQILSQ